MAELATAALDARDKGHAAVTSMMRYSDATQPEPVDVTYATPTRHPGPQVTVFVFTLADGSTRATGVACTDNPPKCVGLGSYPD